MLIRSQLLKVTNNIYHHFMVSTYWAWCVGFVFVLISVVMRTEMYLGTDAGHYLLTAQKILDVRRYYHDFFEPNLPINFYIYSIPLYLSKITQLSIVTSQLVFTVTLPLLSILFSHVLIKKTSLYKDKISYSLFLIAVFYGFFLPFPTFMINEIGTKTLLLLCCMLPYAASILLEIENKNISKGKLTCIVILTGLIPFFKPHYIIFLVACELYLAWRKKNMYIMFRYSNVMIAIIALAHLGWILYYFPEYFKHIIPTLSVSYPTNINGLLDHVIELILSQSLFFLLIITVFKSFFKSSVLSLFFVIYFASCVIFIIEGLGSHDQFSVCYFFGTLLYALSLGYIVGTARGLGAVKSSIIFCSSFLLIIMAISAVTYEKKYTILFPDILSAIEEHAAAKRVLFISKISPPPPSFYSSSRRYSKLPHLTYLDGIIHTKDMSKNEEDSNIIKRINEADEYLINSMVDGLELFDPQIVFVEEKVESNTKSCVISYVTYLKRNKSFASAWKKYRYLKSIKAVAEGSAYTQTIEVFGKRKEVYIGERLVKKYNIYVKRL